MKPEINWRNILFPHKFAYYINSFAELAAEQDYPYFYWNGWIYDTKTLQQICLSEDVE
jgi:hypothetical protein